MTQLFVVFAHVAVPPDPTSRKLEILSLQWRPSAGSYCVLLLWYFFNLQLVITTSFIQCEQDVTSDRIPLQHQPTKGCLLMSCENQWKMMNGVWRRLSKCLQIPGGSAFDVFHFVLKKWIWSFSICSQTLLNLVSMNEKNRKTKAKEKYILRSECLTNRTVTDIRKCLNLLL